ARNLRAAKDKRMPPRRCTARAGPRAERSQGNGRGVRYPGALPQERRHFRDTRNSPPEPVRDRGRSTPQMPRGVERDSFGAPGYPRRADKAIAVDDARGPRGAELRAPEQNPAKPRA